MKNSGKKTFLTFMKPTVDILVKLRYNLFYLFFSDRVSD